MSIAGIAHDPPLRNEKVERLALRRSSDKIGAFHRYRKSSHKMLTSITNKLIHLTCYLKVYMIYFQIQIFHAHYFRGGTQHGVIDRSYGAAGLLAGRERP